MRNIFFLGVFLSGFLNGQAQDTTRLSLLFVGDIMGHDSQITSAYDASTGMYDYTSCYQFVKPYIESVDIAFGNLELTFGGTPYKGYPAFSSPDALAQTLKDIGFDVLVTANNHSCDKGKKGIERTIEMLDSVKLEHTGTFADEASRLNDYPLIMKKSGFTLALLNYTYGTNGIAVPSPTIVNLIDTVQMSIDIARAKEFAPDFIISFMHWGNEYQAQPSPYQKVLTQYLFKKGVAIVIGAHPHVLQPMQFNKQRQQVVVYSLGNFVSGQRDRYKNGGAMVRVELMKTRMDSIVTPVIDSVEYILQYVHRDEARDYYIVPIPTHQHDTTNFIKQEIAKQAIALFAKDSRELFAEYNQEIGECLFPPQELIQYSIYLFTLDEVADWSMLPPLDTFYGVTMIKNDEGKLDYYLGSFYSRVEGEKVLEKINEIFTEKKHLVEFRKCVPVSTSTN